MEAAEVGVKSGCPARDEEGDGVEPSRTSHRPADTAESGAGWLCSGPLVFSEAEDVGKLAPQKFSL